MKCRRRFARHIVHCVFYGFGSSWKECDLLFECTDFDVQDLGVIAELVEADRVLRASNTKSGVHKGFVELPAVRMHGPYRVHCAEGYLINNRNGHPFSCNHPWRRSRYFDGGGDGSNQRRGKPCIGSHFRK